jgi:hypothetical protein
MDHHEFNRINAKAAMDASYAGQSLGCATREQTVGEVLDMRIDEAGRLLRALQDLKASLPGSFLASGQSRIAPPASWPR